MFKKIKIRIVVVFLLFIFPFEIIFAHPGKTDKHGCHICKKSCNKWGLKDGQLHCHKKYKNRKTKTKSRKLARKLARKAFQNTAYFFVKSVIDGDTIILSNGDTLRYIGIDAPETVHPVKEIQCFGKQASKKNKELVKGKKVKITKDISNRDRYGRLLRYVWVDNVFVNDYLVKNGYARVSSFPPDVKYQKKFLKSQKEAMVKKRGLWRFCN